MTSEARAVPLFGWKSFKLDEVKTKLDEVKTKLDEVKTKLDEVKTKLDEVKTKRCNNSIYLMATIDRNKGYI